MFVTPNDQRIVLASASPRRRELLGKLGLTFSVVPSTVAEDLVAGESPEQHVLRLSAAKAREVAGRPGQAGRFFIGSDTIVLRDACILGKPASPEEARAMLASLSGRSHMVLSGYAIFDRAQQRMQSAAVTTRVTFRPLSESDIAAYVATGEPFDKAGGYAIQGIGAVLVRSIEGSYTNVVGLPLAEVIETLEELGAIQRSAALPQPTGT